MESTNNGHSHSSNFHANFQNERQGVYNSSNNSSAHILPNFQFPDYYQQHLNNLQHQQQYAQQQYQAQNLLAAVPYSLGIPSVPSCFLSGQPQQYTSQNVSLYSDNLSAGGRVLSTEPPLSHDSSSSPLQAQSSVCSPGQISPNSCSHSENGRNKLIPNDQVSRIYKLPA